MSLQVDLCGDAGGGRGLRCKTDGQAPSHSRVRQRLPDGDGSAASSYGTVTVRVVWKSPSELAPLAVSAAATPLGGTWDASSTRGSLTGARLLQRDGTELTRSTR